MAGDTRDPAEGSLDSPLVTSPPPHMIEYQFQIFRMANIVQPP